MVRIYKDWEELKIYLVGIGYETAHEEAFRMADGWVGHVDGMIMGDGRFDFFPDDHDFSDNGWLDAMEKRYKDKCDFIGYQYSGRQVDKRQRYFELADKAGADIVIVADTEEYVDSKRNDFDTFYRNLLWAIKVSGDKVFYQWVFIPSEKLWSKQGNALKSNIWTRAAKIHYKPGIQRYCMQKHYVWCRKDITDQELIKWQLKHREQTNPYQFHPRLVIEGVRIRMDRTLRSKEWNKKQAEWAFMNQSAEDSREYYQIARATGTPAPPGYTWETWEAKPHTFDRKTRQRIEL